MGTGGTSPSLPPVDFRGGFRSFPSALLPSRFPFGPLALRFASVLSRTLSLPLPASLCSVRFSSALLSFVRFASFPLPLLRSPLFRFASLSFFSASFPFGLSASFPVRSSPLPCVSRSFRSVLQAVSGLHLSVHPDNCTYLRFKTSDLTIDLIVFFLVGWFALLCFRSLCSASFKLLFLKRVNEAFDRLVSTTYTCYHASSVDLSTW